MQLAGIFVFSGMSDPLSGCQSVAMDFSDSAHCTHEARYAWETGCTA